MDILITDVTNWGDRNCVAGWCQAENRMVRPLPIVGEFWEGKHAGPHLFQMGNIVRVTPMQNAPVRRGLPHSHEDVITEYVPVLVGQVPFDQLPEALGPSLSATIPGIFGGNLHGNYVDGGADCPSLGAVDVPARNVSFTQDEFDGKKKLKCHIRDANARPLTFAGIPHEFKVSSKFLEAVWLEEGIPGLTALRDRAQRAHVRIGLAGPWVKQGNRCYAMVNNVLFY